MSDTLEVKVRESRGTRAARRERAEGLVPAVLYGHGEDVVCLTAPVEEVDAIVRHGSHVLNLKGAITGNALVKEVQWDAFGMTVVHLDLTRLAKGEKVQITVPIELHGFAPGASVGVVSQQMHEMDIECLMSKVVYKIEVIINELNLHDVITVGDLTPPEGVTFDADAEATVVQCVEATPEREEEEEGAASHAEPEVIGQKEEEGDA